MGKTLRLLFLAALSGLLLAFSWPEIGWSPLIFIAWIPLFIAADTLINAAGNPRKLKLFALSFFTFLIWNVGATWWVVNASIEGALLAFFANSLLMAGVFTLSYGMRKLVSPSKALLLLPVFWIAFEFVHHYWQLSWPWLTLGNVFANQYQLIQWYEYTGTSGGTLWIFLINISLFHLIRNRFNLQENLPVLKGLRWPIAGLLIPACISIALYLNHTETGVVVKVAVIQPNIDPYNEKFDASSTDKHLTDIIELAATVTDTTTDWLFGPETAPNSTT